MIYLITAIFRNTDSLNQHYQFQVERLLRAIYRPQNSYCIHVDSKSGDAFKKALAAIAQCFDNVFLASRSLDVQWGRFSVLEADLICMEDLWQASATWKYFINLTGQEFPLKTNAELVKILKVFNGANNIQSTLRYVLIINIWGKVV